MRRQGRPEAEVFAELQAYRDQDVPWRRVLNSICTAPHDAAVRAHQAAVEVNLGDPRIFRGSREMERRAIALIGGLLGKADCAGSLVSGGTEANLLAMYVARKRSPHAAQPEIIVGETVHYSFAKVCDLLNLRMRVASLDGGYRMSLDSARSLIGPDTIALVGTAGSSEFGVVDPIEDLAALAAEHGLHFHVDAATGGFIIPFARALGHALPQFDFSLPGVCSITMDPHKYGLATIPCGGVFFRDQALQDLIQLESFFTATPTHRSFIGTRSGSAAAVCYVLFESLGFEGYLEITRRNYQVMDYLAKSLAARGYSLALPPQLNILAVHLPNATEVMHALEREGWIISVSKRFHDCLRLVVTRHVDHGMVDAFLDVLDRICPARLGYPQT